MRHLYDHEFHILWNDLIEETESQWILQHIDSCEECRNKAVKKNKKEKYTEALWKDIKHSPYTMPEEDWKKASVKEQLASIRAIWDILDEKQREEVKEHFSNYPEDHKALLEELLPDLIK